MKLQRKRRIATDRGFWCDFPCGEAGISQDQSVDNPKTGKALTRPLLSLPDDLRPFKKPDIMAQLKKTWGDRVFSAKEVAEMRAAELDGEGE